MPIRSIVSGTSRHRLYLILCLGVAVAGLLAGLRFGWWDARTAVPIAIAILILLGQVLQLRTMRRIHATALRAAAHASKATARANRAVERGDSARKASELVLRRMAGLANITSQTRTDLLASAIEQAGAIQELRGDLTAGAQASAAQAKHLAEKFDVATAQVRNIDASSMRLTAELAQAKIDLVRQVDEARGHLERRIERLSADDYAQLEALLALRELVKFAEPPPALRGWAAAPTTILVLLRLLRSEEPTLILECGSGASSVWIGAALRDQGFGKCVALEHEEIYLRETVREIHRHNLEEYVEVRFAPLETVTIDGIEYSWYSKASLEDLKDISILFVDGPPQDTGKNARFPAIPLTRDRLSASARIILDDAARPQESEVGSMWVSDWGVYEESFSRVEKGVRVFRTRN